VGPGKRIPFPRGREGGGEGGEENKKVE